MTEMCRLKIVLFLYRISNVFSMCGICSIGHNSKYL